MSDQYTPPSQMPARPTITGAGLDPHRADIRMENRTIQSPVASRHEGGLGTGILVAIVFVVVAIIAAVVFSNRDMFGIGLGVTPISTTTNPDSAVAPSTAQTPAVDQPAAAQTAPAQPATDQPAADQQAPAPAQAPAANP